jgi:CRP-like cAMP-binding protein
MLQQLKNLEPFADLDRDALKRIAHHAQCIELPARRWVQAPGRSLSGHYYLLQGRLKAINSSELLLPSPERLQLARSGVVTVTASTLLRIDCEAMEFLSSGSGCDLVIEPAVAQVCSDSDSWQARFLRSHMLAPLSAVSWQQILRKLTPQDYSAGERILSEGESGSDCFILANGRAQVVRAGGVLRLLGPGDFFGEDALLADTPRNACVEMLTAGRVMVLQQQDFRCWLADVLVAGAGLDELGNDNQRRLRLRVDSALNLRDRLADLDVCSRYLICGPQPVARLAVFLLRQRGIRAELADEPAQARTVRSFAQARSALMDSPRITDMG